MSVKHDPSPYGVALSLLRERIEGDKTLDDAVKMAVIKDLLSAEPDRLKHLRASLNEGEGLDAPEESDRQ